MRTSRTARARARRRAAPATPARAAERAALDELAAWRARAVPDASAPLDAEHLVALLRDCFAALALDPAIAAGFTVNTVHYYRRRDVIDPPEGRTAAARYALRHLWQIAGARLAGHLGLVTLAEARDAMRDADEPALLAFLAARVADARARDAVRAPGSVPNAAALARALPGRAAAASSPSIVDAATPAVMIPLPGDAWCVLPAAHAARHDPAAAHALARALAVALRAGRAP
jgi:hypothetical protein